MADIIHSDVYFEVGRKGLTDEAKAQLAAQGDLLKQNQDYAVLIQGYTDQQGSATYNKKLGMKRAETVKQELLNAGVAEHQMKVVSLGEDGVLCIDNSDTCRHLNRRVHLDIRKIGQEHMVIPAVANTTAIDPADSSIEQRPRARTVARPATPLPPRRPSPRLTRHRAANALPWSGSARGVQASRRLAFIHHPD